MGARRALPLGPTLGPAPGLCQANPLLQPPHILSQALGHRLRDARHALAAPARVVADEVEGARERDPVHEHATELGREGQREVVDNADAGRFELKSGDEVLGYTDYSVADGVMTLPHTVVDEAYSGQGHAGTIVSAALDSARERGLKVRPVCSYVASYIKKHPEYADLVA